MLRKFFAIIVLTSASLAFANFDDAVKLYQNKEFTQAFAEFKRLAEIGDHGAQFNLGVMYYRGESVAVDPVEAE